MSIRQYGKADLHGDYSADPRVVQSCAFCSIQRERANSVDI